MVGKFAEPFFITLHYSLTPLQESDDMDFASFRPLPRKIQIKVTFRVYNIVILASNSKSYLLRGDLAMCPV